MFEGLITFLQRDWLPNRESVQRYTEHNIVLEKVTISQPVNTVVFPSGLDSSQVLVSSSDLLGRTYEAVLLRGDAIRTLYRTEPHSLATEILYFGFTDQYEKAAENVSLSFKYLEEGNVWDNKSSCLVLQDAELLKQQASSPRTSSHS